MYNVFVNKKLLKIVKKSNFDFDLKEDYVGIEQLERIIIELEDGKYNKVLLISDNPEKVFKDFGKIAKVRVAAGGKVENKYGEILFIYRDGVWDLPKGFIEEGESNEDGAMREVEEETGVVGLEVSEFIKTTYHTYRYKGKLVLKISHWYKMKSGYEGELVPQTKEGITQVKWLDAKAINEAMKNTWENIKLLF